MNIRIPHRLRRHIAVLLALVCVESFEVLDGFGIMANTYDPFDLLANAIGVGGSLGLDTILNRNRSRDTDTNLMH